MDHSEVRFDVARIDAQLVLERLLAAGYDAYLARGLSPTGEAVAAVRDADPGNVRAIVLEHAPGSRPL